jgi:hypothetical protein
MAHSLRYPQMDLQSDAFHKSSDYEQIHHLKIGKKKWETGKSIWNDYKQL